MHAINKHLQYKAAKFFEPICGYSNCKRRSVQTELTEVMQSCHKFRKKYSFIVDSAAELYSVIT